MSKVTVVALVRIKPGSEETAIAVLQPVVEHTHLEEGCLTYALHRSATDPGQFVIVESWASQADLDAHFQMPYMGALFTDLADHLAEPPTIHFLGPVPLGDSPKTVL